MKRIIFSLDVVLNWWCFSFFSWLCSVERNFDLERLSSSVKVCIGNISVILYKMSTKTLSVKYGPVVVKFCKWSCGRVSQQHNLIVINSRRPSWLVSKFGHCTWLYNVVYCLWLITWAVVQRCITLYYSD